VSERCRAAEANPALLGARASRSQSRPQAADAPSGRRSGREARAPNVAALGKMCAPAQAAHGDFTQKRCHPVISFSSWKIPASLNPKQNVKEAVP